MPLSLSGTTGVPASGVMFMVGQVCMFAQQTPPSGFLSAAGQAVSRTQYSALFAAIGTTYGAGDGSTTFNLPDLRGEFLRGLDNGRGVDPGRAIGTAQADDVKAHSHAGGNNFRSSYNSSGSGAYWGSTLTTQTGETGGTETRPRNVAVLACIFAGV